jgi:2-(1,2-epoxy-1,2-dihydrophenyl)acetyl-CoA isomerase
MHTLGLTMRLSEALHQEAMAQSVTGASEDTAEALRAFFRKRNPVFKGR